MGLRVPTLFVAILACLAISPARAQTQWWQPVELRVGFAAHDVKPISAGIEPGAALNGELFWRPLFSAFDGSVLFKPSIGGSASLSGDTSYGFIDLTGEYWPLDWLYLDLGGGLAVHDGFTRAVPNRKNLGSRELFHVSADVGVRLTPQFGLSAYFDHLSNAGLAHTNQGLETIGLRGAWWF